MQTAPVEGSHTSINNRIDDVYLATIHQAAQLMDYLDSPKGNIDGVYKRFKNPFYQLFLLTHNLKDMRECSDTSEKVKTWLKKSIGRDSAKEGLEIFVDYQACLFNNLIITRRENR